MALFKRSLPFLFLALWSGVPFAIAGDYSPAVLTAIRDRIALASHNGEHPVVVFDLDDTLINTRERNVRILRDFSSDPGIRDRFPIEAAKCAGVVTSDVHYLLQDTLAGLGVTSSDFVKEASDYWLMSFFSNRYCASDQPNPGAVGYVNALVRSGATVVYLTGRDGPRMKYGTVFNLRGLGFAAHRPQAILIMKPGKEGDDLEFKISHFEEISRLGPVVAAFENEPANINAFQRGFPQALMVFLDTIHSPKPDTPNNGVYWVRDFRRH